MSNCNNAIVELQVIKYCGVVKYVNQIHAQMFATLGHAKHPEDSDVDWWKLY